MDWLEDFNKRVVSASEAVKAIKSGDRVAFTPGGAEPKAVGEALAKRKDELQGVRLFIPVPRRDFGWYEPGWEQSFKITLGRIPAPWRDRLVGERFDVSTASLAARSKSQERGETTDQVDVLILELSPPDKHGFCSFGAARFDKKERVGLAKQTIAQINSKLIRTFGDNQIHYSEIAFFVQDDPRVARDPPPPAATEVGRQIADLVHGLVKSGDTIQIGAGSTTETLVGSGALEGKEDLGVHTEFCAYGIIELVRRGVINGKRKTVNPGKLVAASIAGTHEDLEFVNENPLFELYSPDYTHDLRTIAAHDNMVAINNALMIDLCGQITAESLGTRRISGPGGQPSFAIGALMSKGGRSITVLPSTANSPQGPVSRIVAVLPKGTAVTVPYTAADYVVTEYGIASLQGKTMRQRAEALISIAHPDWRVGLRKAGNRLLGLAT